MLKHRNIFSSTDETGRLSGRIEAALGRSRSLRETQEIEIFAPRSLTRIWSSLSSQGLYYCELASEALLLYKRLFGTKKALWPSFFSGYYVQEPHIPVEFIIFAPPGL